MTSDKTAKLIACFQAVFPALDDPAIRSASFQSNAEWDSLATVTLISVIEQEFQIEVPDSDLQHFDSFERIDALLESMLPTTNAPGTI